MGLVLSERAGKSHTRKLPILPGNTFLFAEDRGRPPAVIQVSKVAKRLLGDVKGLQSGQSCEM